jgi:hypothetical protein
VFEENLCSSEDGIQTDYSKAVPTKNSVHGSVHGRVGEAPKLLNLVGQ